MNRPAYESLPLTLSIDLDNPHWASVMDRGADRGALRDRFGRHVDLNEAVSAGLLEKTHAQRLQACEQSLRDSELSKIEQLAAKANERAWKADDSIPHVWVVTRRAYDGDTWQYEMQMGVFASRDGAIAFTEKWCAENPLVQRYNYSIGDGDAPTFGVGEQPDLDKGGPDIVIDKERLWP